MGIFRPKQREAEDLTARNYLATAPAGARTEVLASACMLRTCELPIASAEHRGRAVSVADLQPVERLVEQLLAQDPAIVATIARKVVFNLAAMKVASVGADSVGAWFAELLGANGAAEATGRPVEVIGGPDPDGSAQGLADVFWMTFRAVNVGKQHASAGEWSVYSSLYTDPERASLAGSVIAWGSLAMARLINAGAVDRARIPLLGDSYRTIPAMHEPGWYPHPKKAGRLPDGDAAVKCYWDGRDWTDRVRLPKNGAWQDVVFSHHAAPDE